MLNPFKQIFTLLLLLAVCGAVADWQYVRKGGVRSGNRDRVLVWTLAAVFLGIVIFYGYSLERIGLSEESVAASCGELTGYFFMLVFIEVPERKGKSPEICPARLPLRGLEKCSYYKATIHDAVIYFEDAKTNLIRGSSVECAQIADIMNVSFNVGK